MTDVREKYNDGFKIDFSGDIIKRIIVGDSTNGNENMNNVVATKVNKQVSHKDAELYEMQVDVGVAQHDRQYHQILEKMHALQIIPIPIQLQTVNQRIHRLEHQRETRQHPGYVDPRNKAKRRKIAANQSDMDTKYNKNAYSA